MLSSTKQAALNILNIPISTCEFGCSLVAFHYLSDFTRGEWISSSSDCRTVRSRQKLLLVWAPRNKAGWGSLTHGQRSTSPLVTSQPLPQSGLSAGAGGSWVFLLFPAWLFTDMEGQQEEGEKNWRLDPNHHIGSWNGHGSHSSQTLPLSIPLLFFLRN